MKDHGRFRSEQHRQERSVLMAYKFYRRRGYERSESLNRGIKHINRLTGMFAVMEASDWKANPVLLAHNAAISQVSL